MLCFRKVVFDSLWWWPTIVHSFTVFKLGDWTLSLPFLAILGDTFSSLLREARVGEYKDDFLSAVAVLGTSTG